MKNMKLANKKSKNAMLACSVLLAAALTGCGVAPSTETNEKPPLRTEIEPSNGTAESGATGAGQTEGGTNESEATLKDKALQAYQEILKAAPAIEGEHDELNDASFGYDQNQELFGNHYDLFAIYDINQDDIPELIALSTINFRWTQMSVYTYADGAAVLLKDQMASDANITFDQMSIANGAYIDYICAENHIHSVWRGTNPMGDAEEENHAYALNGATLTAVDCATGDSGNTVYFYDIAVTNTAENVDAMVK